MGWENCRKWRVGKGYELRGRVMFEENITTRTQAEENRDNSQDG
jgi:hypothetical protein